MRKKIDLVMGARPNFVKVAPLFRELSRYESVLPRLIFTGQHTDENMSWQIIKDLDLPQPYVQFRLDAGSHAIQTASVMVQYESHCLNDRPDFTVVVGDVNSSLGACLAAKKLAIAVGHVEAGLRCGDTAMPEELNRRLIDTVADYLWAPSEDAVQNLHREGRGQSTYLVGNILIDSLQWALDKHPRFPETAAEPSPYIALTLHRPENVDNKENLTALVEQIVHMSEFARVYFPVHPRTKKNLLSFGLWETLQKAGRIEILDPISYTHFVKMIQRSRCVVSDSGGVQEECAYLGVTNLTVRTTTERPITLSYSNRLVEIPSLAREVQVSLGQPARPRSDIPWWDGRTAARIASHMIKILKV